MISFPIKIFFNSVDKMASVEDLNREIKNFINKIINISNQVFQLFISRAAYTFYFVREMWKQFYQNFAFFSNKNCSQFFSVLCHSSSIGSQTKKLLFLTKNLGNLRSTEMRQKFSKIFIVTFRAMQQDFQSSTLCIDFFSQY